MNAKENYWERMNKKYEANWNKLVKEDADAKKNGKIVGRYITHSFADGQAVYKITSATTRQATIEVVTEIGDDWVLPAWGRKTKLALSLVKEFLARRDFFDSIFEKK